MKEKIGGGLSDFSPKKFIPTIRQVAELQVILRGLYLAASSNSKPAQAIRVHFKDEQLEAAIGFLEDLLERKRKPKRQVWEYIRVYHDQGLEAAISHILIEA